jgi:hypothetical protein
MHEIRRHMPHLASSQAIFLFVCGEGGKPRLPAHCMFLPLFETFLLTPN